MTIRGSIEAHRLVLVAASAAMAFGLAGCSPPPPQQDAQKTDALKEELASLRTELAAAQAQSEIRNVMHAYGRTIDARDFDAFAKLWTDDAVYVGGPKGDKTVGGPAIANFLRDILAANPMKVGAPNFHIFFNEEITVTGDQGRATSMSSWVVPNEKGGPSMLILAHYEDEFVRDGGVWKFKSRIIKGALPAPKAKAP